MNKKFLYVYAAALLTAAGSIEAAKAEEPVKDEKQIENPVQWKANFKRVALEFSNTSVSNAREYKDSPNAKLSADSESVIKGVFDFALERETGGGIWSNKLLM